MLSRLFKWILGIVLRGALGKISDAKTSQAEKERDAALVRMDSVETGKTLEVDTVKKIVTIESKFEEDKKARPVTDPFGVDKWNAEK